MVSRAQILPMLLKVKVKSFSRVRFFVAPWSIAHQASLTMGFPSQEHWNGYPFPSPGDLPNPGIEPGSPALQIGSLPFESINIAYSIY